MQKAGKSGTTVGSQHPSPDKIPHSNPAANHNIIITAHEGHVKEVKLDDEEDKNKL